MTALGVGSRVIQHLCKHIYMLRVGGDRNPPPTENGGFLSAHLGEGTQETGVFRKLTWVRGRRKRGFSVSSPGGGVCGLDVCAPPPLCGVVCGLQVVPASPPVVCGLWSVVCQQKTGVFRKLTWVRERRKRGFSVSSPG